jgi:peptidoglycan lytic transglycosylase G
MSNRRPTDPRHTGRPTGALARSPSEQLEPTRPLARSRRRQRYGPRGGGPGPEGRSSGLFRLVSGVFTVLLLLMAIVGGLALALQSWVNAPGPLAATKTVVVPKGEGVHDIASRLERDGVITDRRLFIAGYLAAKAVAWGDGTRSPQLKAGDYQIPQAASIRNIIDILSDGRTIAHRVTIPEGLTSHQIVERLKADPNLTGELGEAPPEGALLPETFIVQRGSLRQAILDNMRSESRRLMEKAWEQRQKGLPFKTWEEALVLASIVEKETGRNDERERVAAVFVNRLRQNMRLQSDPTILYGLSAGKTVWNRPIMKNEIAQKTAHNTYQIDGLPPTPICNPGRASIEAVLNPADTKDLYFVADGNGGHIFSDNLKTHNVSVQKWRALEKEREKEKDSKAKAAAGGAGPQPEKAPEKPPEKAQEKGAADRSTVIEKGAQKSPENASEKGKAAAAGGASGAANAPAATRPGAPREDGSWASTTEQTQPKAKR